MIILKKILKKIANYFIKRETIPIYKPLNCNSLLQNKIVMITGGTGGIGSAIAKNVIDCGGKVIICAKNEKKMNDVINQLGENAKGFKIDLSNVENINNDVINAVKLFPENRIDILVNSAGIHGDNNFFNETVENFQNVIDINLKATYFISQTVAKIMIENNIKGHILNVSSSSALRPASTPYQISKWAINGLTKGLADILLPYGIVVNAIAPGPTSTPMVRDTNDTNLYYENQPSHRYATTEEIANLAIFMISDLGNMIIGDTFYITGGSGTISYHR